MKKIFLCLTAIFTISTTAHAGDFYSVGVDYFKKGDYSNATKNLEQSTKIDPKNVNARYYLAQTYLSQKRIPEAIDQYSRIILLNPSSEAAKLSQKGLSLISRAYNENAIKKSISNDDLAKYKDNYLDYILTSEKIARWASFPLKVYVGKGKQQNIALKALSEWQKKTGNLVNFEYTTDTKRAQVIIEFKKTLGNTSVTKEGFTAGNSKPYYQDDNIIKTEIEILTINPKDAKEIPDEFLYTTLLHELGHTLGFNGHSPKESDIMYYQATKAKALSQRDLNTMMLLYKLDKNTFAMRAKPQNDVQLQQALDYVKKLPDKATGWGNLGDIYRGKKKYEEAVKNYKKAVSIDPNEASYHSVLGSAYADMGDKQNAFTSMKTACDLDKNNDFYLYQFCVICTQTNQKDVGKIYLDNFLKANPQKMFDEKIKKLNQYYN